MNWTLLQNSLLVSGATTALSLVLGWIVAIFLTGLSPLWRRLLLAGTLATLALPPFLVTNSWIHLLGQNGVARDFIPLNIFSLGGTAGILVLLSWPFVTLFVAAALQGLPSSYFEADPALRGRALLRWLLIPLTRRPAAQAALVVFVLSLNNFAVPAILQTKVFPAETWVSFNTTFDYARALQLAWPLFLAPLVIVAFLRRANFWQPAAAPLDPTVYRTSLGRPCFLGSGIISAGMLFISLAVPLLELGLTTRTWTEFLPALRAGQNAVQHSLLFAGLAAGVVVLFSVLTWRLRVGPLFWFAFFIPGVLLGIAFIWIFNRPPLTAFYQSFGIVVAAYAVRYVAPGWSLISRAFQGADRRLSDTARVDGASESQVRRLVQLPQIFPHLAAAFYVTYLLCLWDVETLVLIVPPGQETLALRIFNLLHYGHNAQVNALCLIMLTLAIAPLIVGPFLRTLRSRLFRVSASVVLPFFVAGCSVQSDGEQRLASGIFERVQIIGNRGTAPGQFNKPRSVALDSADNLYVVDMTGRVQKFSPDGKFLLSWQMPQTDLGKPKGMSRDRDGNVLVLEPHYQRVNQFSPSGQLLTQWGVHGTNVGQLTLPRSIGVNSRGDILVSEYTLVDRVQAFSSTGKSLFSFGQPGTAPGEFNRAEGLGLDGQDRIYVADSCNHRIQIFSPDGKFLRAHGRAGSGPGEFSYPYDVRVDSAGHQFVCEFGNSRLQIFDTSDRLVETIGGPGSAPGEFSNPWSIALDSHGNLYVADSLNHRVQKFLRRSTAAGSPRLGYADNSGVR